MVLSALTKDDSRTIVMGANQQIYESSMLAEVALLHHQRVGKCGESREQRLWHQG